MAPGWLQLATGVPQRYVTGSERPLPQQRTHIFTWSPVFRLKSSRGQNIRCQNYGAKTTSGGALEYCAFDRPVHTHTHAIFGVKGGAGWSRDASRARPAGRPAFRANSNSSRCTRRRASRQTTEPAQCVSSRAHHFKTNTKKIFFKKSNKKRKEKK